ncbi:clathrin light chain 2-like [Andrographis paniculata]|uniref:clathrin light chain 2-like n=1 Tax=Andrographis paniculata TaxID=175694 RepID=UPI0021E728DD|nr:clathrin light chain 2-like [Andrographis paniculata]
MGEGSLEDTSPPGDSTEVISEGDEFDGGEPILASHAEMVEESFALKEWRRQNAVRLEEKERMEKEMLQEIIEKADDYKAEYSNKWKIRCESNRLMNREKEKLFLESREKFHGEADKRYWKAIAELIPKEVAHIETKGKKEKQPSIMVIQGPKPGKPTDLSRMRNILVKLKHKPPDHMQPASHEPGKDAKPQ